MKRRDFLKQGILAGGGMLLPWRGMSHGAKTIKIGICADVHQDIIFDGETRLQAFLSRMKKESPEFIIQLGDFCHPIPKNKHFIDIWQGYEGMKHHVLGNHDMDLGSKADTMKFWNMDSNYYSFDLQGFHFIILDANYIKKKGQKNFIDYDHANFYLSYEERPWINDRQLNWLERDLAATDAPTIVFSHQSLENEEWGVVNRKDVQAVLKNATTQNGTKKVLACINGHHHVDYYLKKDDIYYVMINSMSYYWVGDKYKASRYDASIEKQYPHIQKVIPYQGPLFTMLTISPGKYLHFSGMETTFVPPGPEALHYPKQPEWNVPTPKISELSLRI